MTTNSDLPYRSQMPMDMDDWFRFVALREAIQARDIVMEGTGDSHAADLEFVTVLCDHGFAADEFCREELERVYRWVL